MKNNKEIEKEDYELGLEMGRRIGIKQGSQSNGMEKKMKNINIKENEIEKEANYKGIIMVEGYREWGEPIFGTKDEDSWCLEDGDIFSIQDLLDEGYKVTALTGKELFEKGKASNQKDVLKIIEDWSIYCEFDTQAEVTRFLHYVEQLKQRLEQNDNQK